MTLSRLRVHYLDWPGTEPSILLLHPNRTSARVWDFVVAHSRSGNRFVAPDSRGHGLSDYPDDGYTLDDHIDDIAELTESLQLHRSILVGAATGGTLGLLVTTRLPDRVLGLVVVDPGLSLDADRIRLVQRQVAREHRYPDMETARAAMPHSGLWTDEVRDHFAAHSFRDVGGGVVEWRFSPNAAILTEAQLEQPIWEDIDVRCPTLILRGASSPTFSIEKMHRLCSAIPHARAFTVPNAGHRVSQDNPAELARLLDEFVEHLDRS